MLSAFTTKKQEDTKNISEVMSMFITSCVVIVSQLYWYVQIHQNIHIKHV